MDNPLELDSVTITRRFFNDDWSKIMTTLKRQTEFEFSYKPFHTDKAIINIACEHALLLCSNECVNERWSTVGRLYVKFEKWNSASHAVHTLIPSY